MANGRTRTTTRRVDRWAVYDGLPSVVRAALQEGPQAWDAYSIRTYFNKLCKVCSFPEAAQRTAEMVMKAHQAEINMAPPYRGRSPHVAAQATMQLSNREYY